MYFSHLEILGTRDAQETDAAKTRKERKVLADAVEPNAASRKNYIGLGLEVSIDDN
jgi:hypothetical protein